MCPDTGEMTGCSGTSLLTIKKILIFDVQKLESYSLKKLLSEKNITNKIYY